MSQKPFASRRMRVNSFGNGLLGGPGTGRVGRLGLWVGLGLLGLAQPACHPQRQKAETARDIKEAKEFARAAAAKSVQGAGRDAKKDDKTPQRKFEELKADCIERKGFFDTYQNKKDDKLYLALPKDRLGQEFLLQAQIARGIGMRPLFSGMLLKSAVVALERHGDFVYLTERPVRFTARPGSSQERAVEQTYTPSVLESAKIESVRPDGAVLVRVDDWMLGDLADLNEEVAPVITRNWKSGKIVPNKDRSFIESVKVFPDNLSLRARLTYTPSEAAPLTTIPDTRYPSLTVGFSLARLPERPMTPRLADDRVGYFITARKEFGNEDPHNFVRYIRRWRLDEARKDGTLSVPQKPITYYLDHSIPAEFRPHIKEGVEAWNRAFEAAGWKNAVRALDLPKEADADDVRYSVLRWDTSEDAPIGIGQSVVDPRTGEILSASIVITADLLRHSSHSQRMYFGRQGAAATLASFGIELTEASELRDAPPRLRAEQRDEMGLEPAWFASELKSQGALAQIQLAARGPLLPSDESLSKILHQELRFTAMHEVGHTLGLRHNFKSSTETPLDKLGDGTWASAQGLTASIMDYPGVNLPVGPTPAVWNYYPPTLGSADLWTITVGYTADEARSRKLARAAAEPGHAFGSDEESSVLTGLDPRVQTWDLGQEPLTWAQARIDLIRALWHKLPERTLRDDSRYVELTESFDALLAQYTRAVHMVARYVGGQYTSRAHVGDPGARPPFIPVPKAKQREALGLLIRVFFSEEAWDLPQTTLAQLAPSNFRHWGSAQGFGRRRDFPVHDTVSGAQEMMMLLLTNSDIFGRLQDAELKFDAKEILPVAEYLDAITQAMFSELAGPSPRNIGSLRRELQAMYIERLGQFVRRTGGSQPVDVRALSRMQLLELKKRFDAQQKQAGKLDVYTRAHLHELSVRIGKILDARINE